MRIISGSARGRTIVAPQGMDTRPTQDYVRESLFNILRADGQPPARFHARPLRVPSARFTSRSRLRMPRYCPSQISA